MNVQDHLPHAVELQQLPRWAIVAFAARCSRRIAPLMDAHWPKEVHDSHRTQVHHAISGAEESAAVPGSRGGGDLHAETKARSAVRRAGGNVAEIVITAAMNANYAAKSADRDTERFRVEPNGAAECARAAASCAQAVLNAAEALGSLGGSRDALIRTYSVARTAVLRDYSLLQTAWLTMDWDDDTPVPPKFFGPVWSDGAPEGWPRTGETTTEPPVMKISIAIPAGMSEAETQEFNARVAQFFAALSGLHASMGGNGLKILDEASSAPLPLLDVVPIESEPACVGGGR